MDESTFEIDPSQVTTASDRFPARRLPPEVGHPATDVDYLGRPFAFGEHAWDEGGHF